jgi:hypothetical protein
VHRAALARRIGSPCALFPRYKPGARALIFSWTFLFNVFLLAVQARPVQNGCNNFCVSHATLDHLGIVLFTAADGKDLDSCQGDSRRHRHRLFALTLGVPEWRLPKNESVSTPPSAAHERRHASAFVLLGARVSVIIETRSLRSARTTPVVPNMFDDVDVFQLYGTFTTTLEATRQETPPEEFAAERQRLSTALVDIINKRVGFRPGRAGMHFQSALTPLKDMAIVCPPPLRTDFQRLVTFYAQEGNLKGCDCGDADHLMLGDFHGMTGKLQRNANLANEHLRTCTRDPTTGQPAEPFPKDTEPFSRHVFQNINSVGWSDAKTFASLDMARSEFMAAVEAGVLSPVLAPWNEFNNISKEDHYRYQVVAVEGATLPDGLRVSDIVIDVHGFNAFHATSAGLLAGVRENVPLLEVWRVRVCTPREGTREAGELARATRAAKKATETLMAAQAAELQAADDLTTAEFAQQEARTAQAQGTAVTSDETDRLVGQVTQVAAKLGVAKAAVVASQAAQAAAVLAKLAAQAAVAEVPLVPPRQSPNHEAGACDTTRLTSGEWKTLTGTDARAKARQRETGRELLSKRAAKIIRAKLPPDKHAAFDRNQVAARNVQQAGRGRAKSCLTFASQYDVLLGWASCLEDRFNLTFAPDALRRRFNLLRYRARAAERVLEMVTSFCNTQSTDGRPSCTLLVGDYAWQCKKTAFPFKRILRLLARKVRVVIVDEFHTTKCCFWCGHKCGFTQSQGKKANLGVKLCTRPRCPSLGRAMDRDETAVLSIVARFVLGFVGGAFLGGFSWWGWNGKEAPIPDEFALSLFRAVMPTAVTTGWFVLD